MAAVDDEGGGEEGVADVVAGARCDCWLPSGPGSWVGVGDEVEVKVDVWSVDIVIIMARDMTRARLAVRQSLCFRQLPKRRLKRREMQVGYEQSGIII